MKIYLSLINSITTTKMNNTIPPKQVGLKKHRLLRILNSQQSVRLRQRMLRDHIIDRYRDLDVYSRNVELVNTDLFYS